MPESVVTWVEAGGARVLVRDTGRGTPVLLIHGLGSHTGMWAPVERAWPDLRLVSFDAPGVGKSPPRRPPPSIGGLARLVEELLDQLGLEQVDVLGYSLGGTVAQTVAHRAPERVRRLVLVATAPGWGCVPGRWRSMIHLYNPLRYYSRTYYDATIGAMAGGQARTDPAFIARHGDERLVDRPSLAGYYAQIMAVASWSSLAWLHEIAAPTLVVAGGDDPLMPPVNSVLLARRIHGARLQIHPADGHLMLFDDKSPALPAIQDFLTATKLEKSQTWQNAQIVTAAAEHEAVRDTPKGMFPWGLASAAYRVARGM
jgi:pimeloyl-ACP methyl ester carboxylesterase